MAKIPLPPQELLLQLLRYDSCAGQLYWRRRPVSMFTDKLQSARHNAAIWNGRYANKPAFTALSSEGYHRGCIGKRHFQAHRIIWKMVTGKNPDDIDHINGDRADNRFANLRSVTRAENLQNLSISKRNRSGVIGVCAARRGRWRAYARVGTRQIRLGEYVDVSDAFRSRKTWERQNGYHPNHGKPKRHRK